MSVPKVLTVEEKRELAERFTKHPAIRAPMAQVGINHEISPDRLQTG